MNRVRAFAAGAAVTAMLASGAAVYAQGPGGRRGGGPGGPFGPGGAGLDLPVRQLNLTDAQQQQIRDIRKNHRAAAEKIAAELRTATDAERAAVDANNPQQIRSVVTGELAQAEADAAVERAQVRSEILAILTPDQLAQLKTLEANRQSRLGQLQQRLNRNGRQ